MTRSILPMHASDLIYQVDGNSLIDGVSLEIAAGTFTVVLGPNGAGKSLLLRILHGMLDPTSGSVVWSNGSNGVLRRRQAMVFQRPVLLRRSVEGNISYALGALGVPRAKRAEMIDTALSSADLTNVRRINARILSVGEQQRLAVARALASQPDILFLDEPTASLDPASVQRIETLLFDANDCGTAIVLVTHDIGQARRLAQDIVFLHDGRLVEKGPAAEFFDAASSGVARAYLAGEIVV